LARIDDIAKRGRAGSAPAPRLTSEELDARVAETTRMFVDATVENGREQNLEVDEVGARAAEPELARSLRGIVANELTIVTPLAGPDEIDVAERERQIVRGALAKLTKVELQRGAVEAEVKKSGTKDELLDRLVMRLGTDTRAAALLINSVERHPSQGRRHATRLFPFDDLPAPEALGEQLHPYVQRYVRTDLANWFVLTNLVRSKAELAVAGHLRNYDITVHTTDVEAHGQNHPVEMRVAQADSVLRAQSRHEAEAISGVEAFSYLVDQLPIPPLARVARSQPTWRSAGQLRLQTTWMIGVLLALLDESEMSLLDVTSASFERPRGDRAPTVGSNAPHVGSARLRGQHVLDSQQACRHVAAHEQLAAVAAMVRFRVDEQHIDLPVRIAVESSYVAVMTGFGGFGAERSLPLHRRLEDFVARQVAAPTFEGSEVVRVVDAMLARAREAEPPQEADLFARAPSARVRLERG
jgi:hypothetical protein